MEQTTSLKKVFDEIVKPSKEDLTKNQRISLATGGIVLALAGARSFRRKGWMLSLLGGALAYAGLTGKNPLYAINKKEEAKSLKATASIKIEKDRYIVYNFWRKLENLSTFMNHIKEVNEVTDQRSRWTANLNGVDINWEAEITEDVPGEKIAWRSLIISEVRNQGQVTFRDVPGVQATEVTVELEYGSDSGNLARAFASLYHPVFEKQIKNELKECKKLLESGKVLHLHADDNL